MSKGNPLSDLSNQYQAFGLTFTCPLELPCIQYTAIPQPPTVAIRYGEVPESLPEADSRGAAFEAAADTLLLQVPNVGRYLVRGGCEIIIHPVPGATESDLRLFLMGSAFGALLQQRGILPLHAGAVRVGDACVAFLGESGTGKSTLCAFLQQRGYTVLSDDICPVQMLPGIGAVAYPGFTRLKLWADSLAAMGVEAAGLSRARPQLDKYELPADHLATEAWFTLDRVYLLCEAREQDREGIERVEGPDRFQVLLANTYRFRYLEGLGRKQDHFKLCASLLKTVSVFRLRRTFEFGCLSETADWLEEDFRSCAGVSAPSVGRHAAA